MPSASRLFALSTLAALGACVFEPDPDSGLFLCAADADCGAGYRCVAQLDAPAGRSLCWAESAIAAESCNGLDDDRDGTVDEDFDLQTDPANCGACGTACQAGASCAEADCHETDCVDGQDNDADGLVDVADTDCVDV